MSTLASIANKALGYDCPYCAGKKVSNENSFAIKFPKLLKEFDFEKNIGIYPNVFAFGSQKKVWWKCPKGEDHEWQRSIIKSNKGIYCPICKDISKLEAMKVWRNNHGH